MVTTEPNFKKNSPKETRVALRVGIYFGVRSRDVMYHVEESKSKLELF